MGLLGGGNFNAAKKKTKAFKFCPKNVREMLNISNIYESGNYRLEPGTDIGLYDVCYIFEDINYINQDKSEKITILNQLMEWFKSMNVNYKITVANEYRNMEDFLKEIGVEKNKEQYPEIAQGIREWKENVIKDGMPDVHRVMYLTLTCMAGTYEEAVTAFQIMDVQIQLVFQRLKSRIYQLNMVERLKCLHTFFRPGREEEFPFRERQKVFPAGWKNDILPSSVEQFKNFIIMDDLYVSVLFARQYDTSLDEGKLMSGLTRVSFPCFVTLDIAPVDREVLQLQLANAHTNNERAISDELDMRRKNGQIAVGVSYAKEKRKEELESYRDQVADNDEACMFIGFLVCVTAPSEEILAERVELMKRLGKANGVILETYNFRQLKALNTALPFGGRQVDIMRPFLTSSAVALQPFYAQDVMEPKGMIYGQNRTTKNLICGNRKNLKNPHGMLVGHSGTGKSMLIKLTEMAQTLLGTEDDIFYLDPQNEAKDGIEAYGGEYYDLTAKSKMHMNPFEIPEEVFYSTRAGIQEEFVAAQSEFAFSFCTSAMQNIVVTQEHDSVIGKCVRRMYAKCFAQKNLKKQPTLMELREEIKEEMEHADNEEDRKLIRQIYNSLAEYTEGSYDMFAHESNIDFNKRLVGIGLKNVSEKLWETVMITVMHFISNRMEYNQKLQKATHFIVDETQVVCAHKSSADMLLKAVVTFRKFGGICTLALQNLKRALENPALRDMFSNCEYKCFLDQGGVDAEALAQIQELSQAEYAALNEEKAGYGVMVWGKKVLLFDAEIDKHNPLYARFSTNFHEKRKE